MARDDERELKRRKHSHGEEKETRKLPYGAKELTKDDYEGYKEVFRRYLKDKKDIRLSDIGSSEAYARFKSFVHKWNDGELSSRYYDPDLNRQQSHSMEKHHDKDRRGSPNHEQRESNHNRRYSHDKDRRTKDTIGIYPRTRDIVGPTLPTQQDLQLQKEQLVEAAEEEARIRALERKSQRRQEKERLEELAPRADAGTRERKLEKRAQVNATMRAFRDKSPDITISDDQLIGGGDDIKADILRQKKIEEERERRREEIQRGRDAERSNRRKELEKREEGTMEMLKKMAQERWGNAAQNS